MINSVYIALLQWNHFELLTIFTKTPHITFAFITLCTSHIHTKFSQQKSNPESKSCISKGLIYS